MAKDSILYDIQEVFTELGTTFDICTPPSITTTPSNIYGEIKKQPYLVTPLTGMVTFNPKSEQLSDIGITKNVTVIFKVACQTLIDTGIINMSEDNILKSVIKYKDVTYNIVNYIPRSLYQGDFLIYNFECRGGV